MNKRKTGGIRAEKVSRTVEYLMNILLPLPCGGRLPGIRAIMKQTRNGRLTVAHALHTLEQGGFIRIEPDRGIFRILPEEKNEIRLLHWSLSDITGPGFVGDLFNYLEQLASAAGWKLTIENVRQRSQEDIAGELASQGISRCILYGAINSELAEFLRRRMKVCLELLPRHSARVGVELRDAPDMTVRQMDYLFKRGYRRIGYLHFCGSDFSQYPVQLMRLMDYYRLMAENGLRIDPDWVFGCSDQYENLNEGMRQILNTDPKPEVLIVPGSALERLYSYCRKHRILIGRDLAVFGCDDIYGKLVPEATVITNNPKEIAKTFWAMFQAAERGEKVESRYTELFIRTGQTVPGKNIPMQPR